jgi:hypothetical protein
MAVSVYDRLDRLASATNDRINRERFRLIPMKDPTDPNGRRTVDADRPVRDDLYGIFEYTSLEYGLELGVRKSYREANDLRAVSVGRKPILSVDRKYFSDPSKEPRQGDRIELLDRPELPMFEVMDNQREGHSRFELRLVHLGQQA